MPIEMLYNIKCDMCLDVMVDGPYDLGIDGGLHLAPIPWVQLGDWTIVDYRVICPRHKIQIFKGHAHHKKKEHKPDSFRFKPRGSPRDSL